MSNYFKKYSDEIKIALTSFFVFFVTHSYALYNHLISHDSLVEYSSGVEFVEQRIRIGRIFAPIYQRYLRSAIAVPWTIGITGFIFLFIASLLIIKMLEIKNITFKILISIIMVANLTVISEIGTYIHQFDTDMLALLISVLSVYLWRNNKLFFVSSLLLTISVGLYQSYISVIMTLIILLIIIDLLNEKKIKDLKKPIVKALLMILIGVVIYVLLSRLAFVVTGVTENDASNSISKLSNLNPRKLLYGIIETYIATIYNLINPTKINILSFPVLTRIILLSLIVYMCLRLLSIKKISFLKVFAILLLLTTLPLFMNTSRIISGYSHMLMHFALWLIYIFGVKIIEDFSLNISRSKELKSIGCIMICILFLNNLNIANLVYQKKYEEQNATVSLMTRVQYRIESLEGYKNGETPIVFIGKPDYLINVPNEYDLVKNVTGAQYNTVIGAGLREYYEKYYMYVLRNNAIMLDEPRWYEFQKNKDSLNMNSYPDKDSIQMINGICVVKFE